MQIKDIRLYKQQIRADIKEQRRLMISEKKQNMDHTILQRVRLLRQYEQCKVVVTYVSQPIEVDTRRLITLAWADGKRVAVPRCVEGTRRMEFYFIRSFDDMEPQTFGVLEPIPKRCEKVVDFSESLCIVPALAYDLKGYRLGYGAGYYDRFLSRYSGTTVGITYSSCVRSKLWHGRYDIPVQILITEKIVKSISRAGQKNKASG